MNNRKLIFWVIAWVLVIGLLLFLIIAKTSQSTKRTQVSSWKFQIWTVWDSKIKFEEFLTSFKSDNRWISNVSYTITNFPNYKDYSIALNSAIIKWKTPDVFVLNNNEQSLFEEKILAISNENIDIHKFRQNYKTIFSDDLIVDDWEWEEKVSYLKWIPVGYETLWIFYNKRFRLKPSDFVSISSLKSAIIKVERLGVIPIAIWNWSTIINSPDLLAQQFLLNKVKSLKDANDTKIKQTLSEYTNYWVWDNNYNSLFPSDKYDIKNNIELFVDKEVAAIVAYPRAIIKLQSNWFSNSFLSAAAYPHSYSWDGPSLANYNFFVINKDTKQKNVALTLLSYLNSEKWANAYLKKFKYYLPAQLKLEEKLANEKISNFYDSIQLRDFYSDEPLSSFDKWNKVMYDEKIINILDDFNSPLSTFENLQTSILCNSKKILHLENLTASCE